MRPCGGGWRQCVREGTHPRRYLLRLLWPRQCSFATLLSPTTRKPNRSIVMPCSWNFTAQSSVVKASAVYSKACCKRAIALDRCQSSTAHLPHTQQTTEAVWSCEYLSVIHRQVRLSHYPCRPTVWHRGLLAEYLESQKVLYTPTTALHLLRTRFPILNLVGTPACLQ